MPQIKIPDSLKKFFRKEGIDDLPRILDLLATVSPVVIINTQDFPVQTIPGGTLRIINATHTETSPNQSYRPDSGKRWVLYAAGINMGTLLADREGSVYIYDGTTEYRISENEALVSEEYELFNLERVGWPFPITHDLYIYIKTNMVAGDGDSTGFVVVLEVDV